MNPIIRLPLICILGLICATRAAAPATDDPISLHPDRPNVVEFEAVKARLVRLVILASSRGQPCIDELEVYGPGSEQNLALAKSGAKATASSCLAGYPVHQIKHLNDGRYGNSFSWISEGTANEWVQIELAEPARVNRVVFSRDRLKRYQDRMPTAFEVRVSEDGKAWRTVRAVRIATAVVEQVRLLPPNRPIEVIFPTQTAAFVRLHITRSMGAGEPCVDELEVFGPDSPMNLAAAARGGKATASCCLEGHAIHKVEHLNDGTYTNEHSWISAKVPCWAQIELAEPAEVTRVVFSRDRGGKHRDRMPQEFEIRLSMDGERWRTVSRVRALENVPIGSPMLDETPQEWATRVAESFSGLLRQEALDMVDAVKTVEDVERLLALRDLDRQRRGAGARLSILFNPAALRRSVADLATQFPNQFTPPADLDVHLDALQKRIPNILERLSKGTSTDIRAAMVDVEEILTYQRDILLSNPLLDFEELLFLKRQMPAANAQNHTYWHWGQRYGMTVNWSCDFRPKNAPVAKYWDDEIAALRIRGDTTALRTVFEADAGYMIQHPELHFDADRLLLSMPGPAGAFQVWEANVDGTGLRQITTDTKPDVDNGDACYLPDGRIVFNSTRGFHGVPCEDGNSYVANLCICDADGRNTRMLTFDQESNWYPTVLNNGRVLYTRYEYANVSHQFGRLLFQMNPDGTGQMEYYGSNSYWPNSIFYARPIPGHPTMVIGVVCGHHGPNRTGPLVLFDPAVGRQENEGAVQMIPGYGKTVERVVADELYGKEWPKFVHPWPLSEKYFLVSARLSPEQDEYGLYLVDVFDNITEICMLPGFSLLEPIPLKSRPVPPAVPDRVEPAAKEATVFLTDVYRGPGLAGVPRGTVKRLRLFTYNYVYRHSGRSGFGHLATAGVDGPWEPRFLLGTVPVDEDGSALFVIPANTPVAVQPVDADGQAMQVMRSWFSAMPGETLSCAGCHEKQSSTPASLPVRAARGTPHAIEPWRGPPRGFDFELEVQPVLDRLCVGCHDGSKAGRPDLSRKSEEEKREINHAYHRATESGIRTVFTPSFIALHPYVRRPTAESHYGMQVPAEFAANTSPLVQMLKKGHHGVELDAEAWDRLYTWIDLAAPDLGSWKFSEWGVPGDYYERRREVYRRFAGRETDVEWLPDPPAEIATFVPPEGRAPASAVPACAGWPFSLEEAKRRQTASGLPVSKVVKFADGQELEFVLIPAGEFVMGNAGSPADERPLSRVVIDKPFYLSRTEVTNAQLAVVAGSHTSGHVQWLSIDWRGEGYPLDAPNAPAVRVSWHQAMAFCAAVSASSGAQVSLPTESQWEWACRAGSESAFWYGGRDDDFSTSENLAGREQRRFAFSGKRKWYLRDDRFDDGQLVTARVASYKPNPWGLFDMHGNVCEWTLSSYQPYPYADADGRNVADPATEKVVRGGSWFDKPDRATSAHRWKYPPWQKVHNVGFRVVIVAERQSNTH